MQVVRGSAGMEANGRRYAVGIGIFDGVHRGHQALLRQVLALAQANGLETLAYTFDPHPAKLLSPAVAPKLIEPLDARIERIAALGIGTILVEPFTREFAATSAETFASDLLVGRLGAKHVVVGADFTFGRGRGGDVPKLAQWGKELGFEVHPVELIKIDGIVASSTRVREFVWAGAMRGAGLILGRPFCLTGVVQRGAQRGVQLGFGTANLQPRNELLPAVGVYAGTAHGPFGARSAVINVGFAPTFGGSELKIEAHLLDYSGEPLYGAVLTLDFIDRIRDEVKFSGIEALKAQIGRDVEDARRLLAGQPRSARP
jgi:riboflavin kinase/FMN adenylyltransferase